MLIEETSNSLTLVDGEGKHHVILRKDLEELIARGHTHMPQRLEANLTPQQMADLFAFLRATGPQAPATVVHAPALVRPEADGSLRLLARQAEIRAVKVHFDGQQDCLVWHAGDPEDHIAWTVDVPKAGPYLAYIQWTQTPEYADNPFVLKCGASQLTPSSPAPAAGACGNAGLSANWTCSPAASGSNFTPPARSPASCPTFAKSTSCRWREANNLALTVLTQRLHVHPDALVSHRGVPDGGASSASSRRRATS